MSGPDEKDSLHDLLRLLADRLESHLEGDDLAFDTLAESIEEGRFSGDDLQSAVLVLRSLANEETWAESSLEGAPGSGAQRVLSPQERASFSPEAWGALLDLRRRGSLDPAQFEQVLEMLGGCGVRPVGMELALEVATRVALQKSGLELGETAHGDLDLAN